MSSEAAAVKQDAKAAEKQDAKAAKKQDAEADKAKAAKHIKVAKVAEATESAESIESAEAAHMKGNITLFIENLRATIVYVMWNKKRQLVTEMCPNYVYKLYRYISIF